VAVCRSRSRETRQGFVLIVTSIALTVLLALAALGVDLGRMYVIRAELQSFTDAAALTAAMQLDGTDAGIVSARTGSSRLASGPHAMRWDLGTQPITHIAISFSPDNKTWLERPKQASDTRFVRVMAREPAPLIFLRVFQPRAATDVVAASVASKADQDARLIQ
jgi:hypothetical protein